MTKPWNLSCLTTWGWLTSTNSLRSLPKWQISKPTLKKVHWIKSGRSSLISIRAFVPSSRVSELSRHLMPDSQNLMLLTQIHLKKRCQWRCWSRRYSLTSSLTLYPRTSYQRTTKVTILRTINTMRSSWRHWLHVEKRLCPFRTLARWHLSFRNTKNPLLSWMSLWNSIRWGQEIRKIHWNSRS